MKTTITAATLVALSANTSAKNIETSIVINATPEKVWTVFSNFSEYPLWNPFVKSFKGAPKVGQKIEVDLPGMKFKPTVLAYNTNRELRWKGKFLFRGLFDGEHYFKLIDNGNGTTTFIQGEYFNGLLLPLFSSMLQNKTKPGFEEMNEKLKIRVEQTLSQTQQHE